MVYATNQIDGSRCAVIGIDGKFDDGFMPEVKRVIKDAQPFVLINLSKSKFIKGDHMEWLVEAHHTCDKAGGKLALTDIPTDFRYILSIMELDKFFHIFETEGQGLEAFNKLAAPAAAKMDAAQLDEIMLPPPPPEAVITKSRREQAKQEAADREVRVELFVRHVAPGMAYLRVFEVLAKAATAGKRKVVPKNLAKASKRSAGEVSRVLKHLEVMRICTKLGDGSYQYSPGDVVAEDIAGFLMMWNNPNNHGKVYKWVYNEEQTQRAKGGIRGLITRMFKK